MTGYVRTCDGRRLTLPALLQWSVRLTDGDPLQSTKPDGIRCGLTFPC